MNLKLPYLSHAALILLALSVVSCSSTKTSVNSPATAEKVDPQQYVGRWYEIARLPNSFQKPGEGAIAEYGNNDDGTISVRNIAVKPDGRERDIRGTATILNPPANTKLAVRFNTWFGPFIPVPEEGNYWILHVDRGYQEALVGTPNRNYLWMLARTPNISQERYSSLVTLAKEKGYDVDQVQKSPTVPARQESPQRGE